MRLVVNDFPPPLLGVSFASPSTASNINVEAEMQVMGERDDGKRKMTNSEHRRQSCTTRMLAGVE